MATKRYAHLSFPGSFFANTRDVEVTTETAQELFEKNPNCYKIQFYTQTVTEMDGEELRGKITSEPKSHLRGKGYSLTQMEQMLDKDEHRILLDNVRINGWYGAVKCKIGNWQPWTDDIEIVET